jgi:Domain of Unknown Function (DUF1080)
MTETISANDPNWMAKMGASVFVTVLAPVLVAFGVKMSERVADVTKPAEAAAPAAASAPATPAAQAPAQPAVQPQIQLVSVTPSTNGNGTPVTQVAVVADPAAVAAALAHVDHKPIGTPATPATAPHSSAPESSSSSSTMGEVHPTGPPLRLFNGLTLDGFYTWFDTTEKTRAKDKGKDKDQEKDKDKEQEKENDTEPMFTVSDGVLHATGKRRGGLTTIKPYSNYQLSLEYRWAGPSVAPREKKARQSALLLHSTGADGTMNAGKMRSIRCALTEGRAGDLRPAAPDEAHPVSFAAACTSHVLHGEGPQRMLHHYMPGVTPKVVSSGWVKRYPSGPWEDVLGYRGPDEIELPVGEWNKLECTCREGRIKVTLNGNTVNEVSHSTVRRGKITLLSGGAPIDFREIKLQPISGKTTTE